MYRSIYINEYCFSPTVRRVDEWKRKAKKGKVSVRDKVYMTILCYELQVTYLGVFLLHMYEHEYEYEYE